MRLRAFERSMSQHYQTIFLCQTNDYRLLHITLKLKKSMIFFWKNFNFPCWKSSICPHNPIPRATFGYSTLNDHNLDVRTSQRSRKVFNGLIPMKYVSKTLHKIRETQCTSNHCIMTLRSEVMVVQSWIPKSCTWDWIMDELHYPLPQKVLKIANLALFSHIFCDFLLCTL